MLRNSILLILMLSFMLVSCKRIRGSGNIIERNVDISEVTSVDLSGVGTAYISIGDKESLTIKGDDNIIEKMDIDVHGHTLELGKMKGGFVSINPSREIEYFLTVKRLESLGCSGSGKIKAEDKINADDFAISISGSGEIYVQDLRADYLNVHISGSGDCDAGGAVKKQKIHISGSGKYLAKDMESEVANCHVSGSGKVEVRVSENLNVDVSGSGDVYYWGRPNIDAETSGSGSVKNRGD